MSEKTTDDEPNDEDADSERSVIDEIRHRRADEDDENGASEHSGSKLRTLLYLGFAFIAGYLVGRGRSEPEFREDFGEFEGTEGGPMEIEIHDTDSVTESNEDEEDEESDESGESDEAENEDEPGSESDDEE